MAIAGIASAIAIYATMGERAKQTVAPPPLRSDPNAIIESSGNVLQQVRGSRQDYLIEAERQLTYANGATKLIGVKITVRNRGGRDYVVTGREATAGENQRAAASGGVTLAATTVSSMPTPLRSARKRMMQRRARSHSRALGDGAGVGMSYARQRLLLIRRPVHVTLRDSRRYTMKFTSSEVKPRARNHPAPRVTSTPQRPAVIDATRVFAPLTEDNRTSPTRAARQFARRRRRRRVDAMSARHRSPSADDADARRLGCSVCAVAMTCQGGSQGASSSGSWYRARPMDR